MKKGVFLLFICLLLACSEKKEPSVSKMAQEYVKLAGDFTLSKKQKYIYNTKAFQILKLEKNDSLNRASITKVCENYRDINAWEELKKTSKFALQRAIDANSAFHTSNANFLLGDYYINQSENDSAFYYFLKSKSILETDKRYARFLPHRYIRLGMTHYYTGDLLAAQANFFEALKEAKKYSLYHEMYKAYAYIAINACALEDYKSAIDYNLKAIELVDKYLDNKDHLKDSCLNNIGYNYFKLKEYQLALKYYNLGLEEVKNVETNPKLYALIHDNIANLNLEQGNLKKIPEIYYKTAKIRKDYNIQEHQNNNRKSLSKYFFKTGNLKKAQDFGIESLRISQSYKSPSDVMDSYKNLMEIDSKNVDKYIQKYFKLADSLKLIERLNRDKFARIAFETDQIVIEKNQAIKQKWAISISATALLLFMTLLFIIKMQRARQKELLLLQVQQKSDESIYQLINDQQIKINHGRQTEKKRIARELHDGVMNKLTSTRLNLFVLNKKKDDKTIEKCIGLIDGIQEIEKEIRQVAHDLDNDLFSGNKSYNLLLEALFDDFREVSTAKIFDEIDPGINWEKTETALRMNVYRILQESLQNANKYAQAKNIFVTIKKQETDLHLIIHDDGIGFNLQKAKKGIGLKNIAQRVKSLNGEMVIKTEKGQGALINIRLPLPIITGNP